MHDRSPQIDGKVDTSARKGQIVIPCRGIIIDQGHVRGNRGDSESKILSQLQNAPPCLLICLRRNMGPGPGKCLRVEFDGVVAVTGNQCHRVLEGKPVKCHGVECGLHDASGPFLPAAENETGFQSKSGGATSSTDNGKSTQRRSRTERYAASTISNDLYPSSPVTGGSVSLRMLAQNAPNSLT